MNQMKLTRPIVRYHGGKWKLAPWIISHFPAHRCYVEPFGGGGSVLLRKPRSYAEVYNDLDREIVNVFRTARDQGFELKRQLETTPFSREEFEDSYTPSKGPITQARKTIVRAFMGFGSNAHLRKTGFRSNSNRSGTTPAHDWANYSQVLPVLIERLQGVVIENKDALAVMWQHDAPTTLHYVDPPYVKSTRDKGGDYRHEMTDDDHRALASALNNLAGMVIVSGYDCPLYSELFAGWRRVEKSAHADGARERTEVLWMRNVPEANPTLL
jgi:DNA adenine methylase